MARNNIVLLRYNTTNAQTYGVTQNVLVVPFCNGFTVTNVGDDPVTVNGRVLYPGTPGTSNGDSFSFGGNFGEVYKGNISIQFAGTGVAPLVTVEQKFYILDNETFEYYG